MREGAVGVAGWDSSCGVCGVGADVCVGVWGSSWEGGEGSVCWGVEAAEGGERAMDVELMRPDI